MSLSSPCLRIFHLVVFGKTIRVNFIIFFNAGYSAELKRSVPYSLCRKCLLFQMDNLYLVSLVLVIIGGSMMSTFDGRFVLAKGLRVFYHLSDFFNDFVLVNDLSFLNEFNDYDARENVPLYRLRISFFLHFSYQSCLFIFLRIDISQYRYGGVT